MEYTKLGRSGLEVSRICLGCMSYGDATRGGHQWVLDEDSAQPFFKQALDAGINFFDTANAYSAGSSEEFLGRALNELGADRDSVVIATKVFAPQGSGPNHLGTSRKAVLANVDASLNRLGTDFIDLYQVHAFDNDTPLEETLEALHDVVKSGRARYIGASNFAAWQLAKALFRAEQHDWTKFVSIQNHYNLLDRSLEQEVAPLCSDQGVGVIPWSPLARGRLARPWGDTTERSKSDDLGSMLYQDAQRAVVDAVEAVALERGVSMAQVATAWMLSKPEISAPIIGATRPVHLDDAVAAVDLELSPDEIAQLEAAPHPN